MLIVSSNAGAFGGDPVAQHRSAIEAAKTAGARRILYPSHQGASPTSAFRPCRDHAATEALLAASNRPWTSLRNGYCATTVDMLVGDAAKTGTLRAPADGKVSWTQHADLAEAAAIILAREGMFDGPVTLTAGEMLDLADIAKRRAFERVVVPDEAYLAGMIAGGVPAGRANLFASIFTASRAGEFAVVDPTLEKLLGRKPA